MTYGYTNRNRRGENHVFSFIISHSVTVSSWVSKQPRRAVMRTACCHRAPAAAARARALVPNGSRRRRCPARGTGPPLAPLPFAPCGRAQPPAGCSRVPPAPAASSPRPTLTRCRLRATRSGLLPVIVQGNYVPNFPPEPRCKLTPKCPVKWLHHLHASKRRQERRPGCFAVLPSPHHSGFRQFYCSSHRV